MTLEMNGRELLVWRCGVGYAGYTNFSCDHVPTSDAEKLALLKRVREVLASQIGLIEARIQMTLEQQSTADRLALALADLGMNSAAESSKAGSFSDQVGRRHLISLMIQHTEGWGDRSAAADLARRIVAGEFDA